MIADRIKTLRETNDLTQNQLARKLGVTRASVNAWEMGQSSPNIKNVLGMADIFNVSTDYVLGRINDSSIDTEGLTTSDIDAIYKMILYLRHKNESED